MIGDLNKPIKHIVCTGAAQGYIELVVAAVADGYISCEISEKIVHVARESAISYISAGHHAKKRFGIQALGEHLAQKLDFKHEFIDIDNPV